MGKRWTEEDDSRLKELMSNNTEFELIASELNRSITSIQSRAAKLKFKHKSTYGKLTEEQLDYIKNNYPSKSIHTLKKELNKPWETIRNALVSMGIEVNIEKAWTNEEIEQLRILADKYEVAEVAKRLDKTINSVYLKARKLNIVFAMSPRKWSDDDKSYLIENWGQTSVETLAKNLKRKPQAVMQQAHKMKLEHLYCLTDSLTLTEFQLYTGISRDRIINTLLKYDFPLNSKRLTSKKKIYNVDIDKALKWMESHQDLFDGSKVSEDIFIPEPKWLTEKRRKDRVDKTNINYQVKKTNWTDEEISYAKSLLGIGLSHEEIAKKLHRSKQSVQFKLAKNGQAYKSSKFWTGKEFKYIRENWEKQSDKEMAEHLKRPVKSVEYHRLELGLKRREYRRNEE